MSDDGCGQFLIKGSPFLFPPEKYRQAVADLKKAKHIELVIAKFILSYVEEHKKLLATKHMTFIAKRFGTTSEDLNKYEAGLTMPSQLVLGTAYYLSKNQSGLYSQIDNILKNCCSDYFQFFEAALPKCCAFIYQNHPWHKVLCYARKYCSDQYYQVGVRVTEVTFLNIRTIIKRSQESIKH